MISVRVWLFLMAVGAVIAILLLNAPANAQAEPVAPQVINYAYTAAPVMCSTLDAYPSLPGVDGVLDAIHDDSGFTWTQTAQALVLGVQFRCTRHIPLLQRYANTTNGPVGVSA